MRRIITWFVTNSVATNLLVGFAVVAGVAAFSQIPVRTYPDFDLPVVSITVPYLGAAPEEVERGVCTRIEDHVDGVVGIREVLATADEGICSVRVELLQDADRTQALNDIRNRIGAIETFPAEAEAPLVRLLEVPSVVIEVAVTGPSDERRLKELARQVRADILSLPGITQATVANVRPFELAIEVSEESLLRNGLTFDQVAAAVSRNSVDLPGGTIKAEQGQVLLRTKGQAYNADELNKLVVKARPDGSRVLLEDVAHVIDGFEDTSQRFVFDGAPGRWCRSRGSATRTFARSPMPSRTTSRRSRPASTRKVNPCGSRCGTTNRPCCGIASVP
ncbi:MAG: efflux RND transporter permease subunit [Gammaproteobacteria bacterium]|nr:efflux RND transporter permease subunit [Gammaproteobacteria bacterium]MYB38147.1 efflux RND transporter permease subunit [Gammaproteobacteria bacterium]